MCIYVLAMGSFLKLKSLDRTVDTCVFDENKTYEAIESEFFRCLCFCICLPSLFLIIFCHVCITGHVLKLIYVKDPTSNVYFDFVFFFSFISFDNNKWVNHYIHLLWSEWDDIEQWSIQFTFEWLGVILFKYTGSSRVGSTPWYIRCIQYIVIE